MHTHTKTALTNENDERELWPQHDHEIVYGVFLTFSSLSFPRTLLLWHQISCLSTVSIKIQHQYAPKWIESELINLNWAIGCITATATAVSRPFTAITLQRVHASAKKSAFFGCVIILKFWNLQRGKKLHLILMCCRFFCSNCRFKRSFGEAHYRSSDMVYIQNIVCASFRISRASYCCCLMFFFRKLCFCFIRCLFQCSGFDRANVRIFNIVTYAHMDVCVSVRAFCHAAVAIAAATAAVDYSSAKSNPQRIHIVAENHACTTWNNQSDIILCT